MRPLPLLAKGRQLTAFCISVLFQYIVTTAGAGTFSTRTLNGGLRPTSSRPCQTLLQWNTETQDQQDLVIQPLQFSHAAALALEAFVICCCSCLPGQSQERHSVVHGCQGSIALDYTMYRLRPQEPSCCGRLLEKPPHLIVQWRSYGAHLGRIRTELIGCKVGPTREIPWSSAFKLLQVSLRR